VRWVGLVVETAVGQRPTEALVEKQEQECDLDAFSGRSEASSTRRFWATAGTWSGRSRESAWRSIRRR
jgi:hypothetical protein